MTQPQYDQIAENYCHSDASIVKNYVVGPFFASMLGKLNGQSVVDLACGSGFATRIAQQAGASRVVGIDVSAEQIRLAQAAEEIDQLGIHYVRGDVAEIELAELGAFDVATAVFLLPYAANRDQLVAMCRNIYSGLVPGGQFINVLPNPEMPVISTTKYQMTATMPLPPLEGEIRTLTYHSPNATTVTFNQYYWSSETYEWALKEAGFQHITWIEPTVSPTGIHRYGTEFWREYCDNPHQIGLHAIR